MIREKFVLFLCAQARLYACVLLIDTRSRGLLALGSASCDVTGVAGTWQEQRGGPILQVLDQAGWREVGTGSFSLIPTSPAALHGVFPRLLGEEELEDWTICVPPPCRPQGLQGQRQDF